MGVCSTLSIFALACRREGAIMLRRNLQSLFAVYLVGYSDNPRFFVHSIRSLTLHYSYSSDLLYPKQG